MPNDSAVALIAPYVAHDLARAQSQGEAPPTLSRMAGRGEVQLLPALEDLDPWRVGLLSMSMLGLELAATRFPEGAVTAAADLGLREGCWLKATPLNFAAGMSNLAASALVGPHAVSAEERLQLGETLAAHLRSAGFQLEEMGGQWVVRAPETLNAVTRRPELAIRDLDSAMPSGPDAPLLRRLMAELQMLLHEHAVNQHRVRRGSPEVNAIWLHGIGGATRARRGELPQAFGDEPYLRGLYKLHDCPVQAPLGSAGELLARKPDRALVLVDAPTLEVLEMRWLDPLMRAVRMGRIASLDVVLARWRLRLDRLASWKLWRRPLPLAEWPQ
jgi:hypothetical protein